MAISTTGNVLISVSYQTTTAKGLWKGRDGHVGLGE